MIGLQISACQFHSLEVLADWKENAVIIEFKKGKFGPFNKEIIFEPIYKFTCASRTKVLVTYEDGILILRNQRKKELLAGNKTERLAQGAKLHIECVTCR